LDAGFTLDAVVEPTLDDGDTGDESAGFPPDSVRFRVTV